MVTMINTAHKIAAELTEKVMLPEVYHSIRTLLASNDVQANDFVGILRLDTSLCLRIIKIANSNFYNHYRKVTSLHQAISMIGILQLHDLVLSSLVIRAFSAIPSDIFNQKAFWKSSIYCGITARILAEKCMVPAKERLFSAGLLHEIGHIVMYCQIPDQMQEILIESQQKNIPLYRQERTRLGFDYGQVGSELMQLWHLPQSYCDIARFHTEPITNLEDSIEIQIVNLAHYIMLSEEQKMDQSLESCLKLNYLVSSKLMKQDIENIRINARMHVSEVMDCL